MSRSGPAAAVTVLLAALSCQKSTTGVCVYTDATGADQLRISVLAGDGTVLYPERPDAAALPDTARPLTSKESFCVYLADSRAETPVTCRVQALSAGGVVRRGGTTVMLHQGRLVDCPVALAAATSGDDAAGCADGTREGFTNAGDYPDIAACASGAGAPMTYQTAAIDAPAVCQAGWHWCAPDDAKKLPLMGPVPEVVAAPDYCAWLDFETPDCAPVQLFGGVDCTGLQYATGAMKGTGACDWPSQGDQTCDLGWRSGLLLRPATPGDVNSKPEWPGGSMRRSDLTCFPHVSPVCATAPGKTPNGLFGPRQCWVGCCRD